MKKEATWPELIAAADPKTAKKLSEIAELLPWWIDREEVAAVAALEVGGDPRPLVKLLRSRDCHMTADLVNRKYKGTRTRTPLYDWPETHLRLLKAKAQMKSGLSLAAAAKKCGVTDYLLEQYLKGKRPAERKRDKRFRFR